jgi:replication factor A1
MSTAPRRPFRGRGAMPSGTGYVRRGPAPGSADAAKPLRKPVFTTVDQLRPQTHGHTLTARVIAVRTVLDKPSTHLGRTRVAECLVGDSTGTVLVTARNEQGMLLAVRLLPLTLFLSLIDLSRFRFHRQTDPLSINI